VIYNPAGIFRQELMMKNALFFTAAIASVAGLAAAFGGSAPQPAASSPAPAKSAPAPAATAEAAAMQIFSERCATKKCHGGESPKKKLDLSTPASVKAGLINVDADENSSLKRVAPGKPEESYLFLKITKGRRNDSRIKWKQMPPEAPQALDDKQIAVIEAWIKSLS
jgi:mono/diheme cytochrome c family protein